MRGFTSSGQASPLGALFVTTVDQSKGDVTHLLTDGRGVPLAALISGANVPDAAMFSEVLDARRQAWPKMRWGG